MKSAIKWVTLAVLAATVAFIGGAFSTMTRTFPFDPLMRRPVEALYARVQRAKTKDLVTDTQAWRPTVYPQPGVVTHVPDKSWGDYTMYLAQAARAYLIDKEGEVVHEWSRPFSQVWPNPSHIDSPSPDEQIFWRRARVFSNGDILVDYTSVNDTPYGYGLARLDKNSEVVWKYPGRVHHDFDVAEDGTIHAITHQVVPPLAEVPQLPREVLADFVVRVSPEGEELARVSLVDALFNSPYRAMLEMYDQYSSNPSAGETAWDPIHANTVEAIDESFARHHDFAEAGQVLVSFRGMDAVALVDMERETIVWATRGFWWGQHHPVPLPNGNFLLFDNGGHGGEGGRSRVLEYDPAAKAIVWRYAGSKKLPFWSKKRGSLQPLSNGNVLVTSSWPGRLFEVTRDGEVVWDFHNPRRVMRDGQEYTSQVTSGQRYSAEELEFLDE